MIFHSYIQASIYMSIKPTNLDFIVVPEGKMRYTPLRSFLLLWKVPPNTLCTTSIPNIKGMNFQFPTCTFEFISTLHFVQPSFPNYPNKNKGYVVLIEDVSNSNHHHRHNISVKEKLNSYSTLQNLESYIYRYKAKIR